MTLRIFIITALLLMGSFNSFAQLKLGDNPQTIDPAVLLELESTSQGFIPPRMTTAQRDAISNPPTGLILFNASLQCLQLNVGTPASPNWQCLATAQGTISSLNCAGASLTGTLTDGQPATGVSVTIPYSGGNGGTYNGQTIASTGVTGLTASIATGNFQLGNGTLFFSISGTASGSGTASFSLNMGGQSCSLSVPVSPPASFNCSGVSITQLPEGGLLTDSSYSGTVSIPYTSGNGAAYASVSLGPVSGITLTRVAGTYNSVSGNIVYDISGTYSGTNNGVITFSTPEGCSILIGCGGNFTVSHTAGSVAPLSKTVTYGTLRTNLATGSGFPAGGTYKCWITQNLGADNQATSSTDATAASAGWYWQFNRAQGYNHDGSVRTPSIWTTGFTENSNWTAANDPCTLLLGAGWRLPTATEWTNADVNGGWTSISVAYNSVLKLHAAGYLAESGGAITQRGASGIYWSSTQNTIDHANAFVNASVQTSQPKARGNAVRCIRN